MVGQGHRRVYCVCVFMCTCYPAPEGWCSRPIFSLLSTPRSKAGDGEPHGLTVVTFMKQLGTGWEEDVGELGDLPDNVHGGQNSLQRSRGSERGRGCQDGPPTFNMRQIEQFPVPRVLPSHLLAHIGAWLQEQFLHLSGQVPAHLSRAHSAQSAQGQALYCLNPLAQVTAESGGWSVKVGEIHASQYRHQAAPWDFPVPHSPSSLIPSASQNPLTS